MQSEHSESYQNNMTELLVGQEKGKKKKNEKKKKQLIYKIHPQSFQKDIYKIETLTECIADQ
mgnify:CR=1 FL=1